MASASLVVRISAQIAEFQKSFQDAAKVAKKFSEDFEGIATRASAVGTFIGNIATKIATSLTNAFSQGLRDAIRLSSEFSNAFIGLSSVARAFGTDADLATKAAQGLSSDGLLPLKDSATGLKNLLATGFSLDQSVQLMNAFKDAAAFGRQGALSFGDAVRSATEGVKNGNSILVDNAGITKNLSQILKEAGFSAQDLSRASSDAGVRLALFNGILKESAAFTGDAARLTDTYSGNISKLDFAYDNLLATLGAAITQNATVARAVGAVADAFFGLNQNLVNNRNAFNLVSDGVIFLVRSLSGILNAIDLVQTGFAGLQIASNRLFEAFANIGAATFRLIERVANLQQYLDPINMKRHAAAAEEAREAYTFLEGAAQGLRDASRDAQTRSESLGNALQGVRAKADQLAKELQETRGKTIELGTAAGRAGVDLSNDLGGGADKAREKLKKLADSLKDLPLLARRAVSELRNVVFVPGSSGGIAQVFIDQIDTIPESSLRSALVEKLDAIFQTIEFDDGWIARNAIDAARRGAGPEVKQEVQKTFEEVFQSALSGLSQSFAQLSQITGGQFGEIARQIGQVLGAMDLGAQSGRQMGAGLDLIGKGGKNAASGLATFTAGLVSAIAAMEAATQSTSRLQNALSGGATGASIGSAFGPYGAAVGFLAGAIYGLIQAENNASAQREAARRQASALRQEILRLSGGYDQLADRARLAGIDIASILGADLSPEEVQRGFDEFTRAWERLQKGLDTAAAGVLARAEIFARPFREMVEAINEGEGELDELQAKLAYTAQVSQGEFERLGTFIGATFAALVRVNGDAIGAIQQLAPAFEVLREGVDEFGLSTTGVIDQLLGMFNLVTDETTGPILEAISATGQIFQGLSEAGFLTADLFQTVATDIGESFRELEASGGDVAAAMALSQPVLQRLWEAQQTYGEITDETTRKLLEQAEQQGLVGDHMRDVNERILQVLIAIADVFGADLPDAFRNAATAADEASRDIRDSLGRIRVPPIDLDVNVSYNDPGFPGSNNGTVSVPALAAGGVVTRPTLALVGEAGPEAVVPLSQLGSFSGDGFDDSGTTVIFEVDGVAIAEATVPHIPGVVRRYGLV